MGLTWAERVPLAPTVGLAERLMSEYLRMREVKWKGAQNLLVSVGLNEPKVDLLSGSGK